ncbi:MAG: hypothetical protein D6772_08055, partial [Bacteroidetes bacterium]
YYRYRPRAEGSVTLSQVDMRMSDGLIADGFLQFIQTNNEPFTVTLEATSHETRDELFYRPRPAHVRWDGAAFAMLLIPFSLALLHLTEVYPLVHIGFGLGIGILLISALLWIEIYYRLFKRLPRYRYIYAIEQFKQYRANDQWVAYSYDVFSRHDEERRKELIRQCTRYGFGLLEINEQRKVRLILAPSRAENFVPKRKAIQFLTRGEWQNKMSNMVAGSWGGVKQAVKGRLKPLQSQYFRWFPRTYPNQWALALAGSIATIFLLRIEYEQRPFVYANKWLRQIELSRIPPREMGEPLYYIVDEPIPDLNDSIEFEGSLWQEEDPFNDIIQGWSSASAGELRPVRIVSVRPGEQAALYYDCARIRAAGRRFYVLYDTLLPDLNTARQRLTYWNAEGFAATAVWPACLGGPPEGFLVYVDEILPDTFSAKILRDSFQLLRDSTSKPLLIREFLSGPE